MDGRLGWLVDRLRAVPIWRLLLLLVPMGTVAFFLSVYLTAGRTGWAIFFGLLLVLSLAVVVSALIIKVMARRSPESVLHRERQRRQGAANEAEAREILRRHLAPLRELAYEQLKDRFLDKYEVVEAYGPSGAWYELEIQGFWDERRRRTLRITASISGRDWRTYFPLVDDFIMAPDGSFVGE